MALFLCGHYGEFLDDVLYLSSKGKRITIKTECYGIMARMLCGTYRAMRKLESLENKIIKTEYEPGDEGEQDYTQADKIVAALCLTENMDKALNYRMSGMSYPEIGRQLSRATSTVYEYFVKMRQQYTALYGE